MGVPTSEVGYTSAMPRREDHEVHKDMWGHWGKTFRATSDRNNNNTGTDVRNQKNAKIYVY